MLRQDGDRKNHAIKQAEKDKKALQKQLREICSRYEQASAGLVQLTQETASFKKQQSSEKARLKAQKDKLEDLCRVLRTENTQLKQSQSAASATAAGTKQLSDTNAIDKQIQETLGASGNSVSAGTEDIPQVKAVDKQSLSGAVAEDASEASAKQDTHGGSADKQAQQNVVADEDAVCATTKQDSRADATHANKAVGKKEMDVDGKVTASINTQDESVSSASDT